MQFPLIDPHDRANYLFSKKTMKRWGFDKKWISLAINESDSIDGLKRVGGYFWHDFDTLVKGFLLIHSCKNWPKLVLNRGFIQKS
jgi:hypothetical protein